MKFPIIAWLNIKAREALYYFESYANDVLHVRHSSFESHSGHYRRDEDNCVEASDNLE